MKKIKYSLVAVAFLAFVGCGGGGGSSSPESTQTKDTQGTQDAQGTQNTRQVTYESLQTDIKKAKDKISDTSSEAYKNVVALEDEIKKLQILEKESSVQTRAVIPVNFDLTTIPARLQLANELLKAIVLTATSDEYKYKKSSEITKISLKIFGAIFNVVNPLSKDKSLQTSIKNLNTQLDALKASPDQSSSDVSNVNLKEDLAKVLRKYRAKSEKITDQKARADFDSYILRITGVRLDPKATVADVKKYINEIPSKYEEARAKSGVEKIEVQNENLTQEQMDLVFDVLKSSQDLTSLENISSEVKTQIDKLVKIFGGLGLLSEVNITGTSLSFDLKTLNERSKLAIDIIRTIVISTNDFKYKVEDVHVQLGFSVTSALITASNPFANSDELQVALTSLNDKLNWAKKQPNVQSSDIASLYIKEAMAKKLREYRTFQFNVLKNKHKDVIESFNQKILEATGVRLDPSATVQQVYNTLKSLESAAKEAISSADLTSDEISASQAQRMELDALLHEARFLDLSDKELSVKEELNKIVLKITGIRLDLKSTVQDIENAKQKINQAMQDAKNAPNLKDNLVAPLGLKIKLSNLLAKARFTPNIGFSHQSVLDADKVWWNTKATVKDVIQSINTLENLMK